MISYPFVSKTTSSEPYGDRAINHTTEREFNRLCWSDGVFMSKSDGSDLQIIADGGMTLAVNPGGCHIQGCRGYEKTKRKITLDSAHPSLHRVDRIVARMDDSDSIRNIELYKKVGTPSTTPVAPNLIRQPNYYEIALADIYVKAGVSEITNANIVDLRLDREVCGMVVPAFPTPLNLEAIASQYTKVLKAAADDTALGQVNWQIAKVKRDVSLIKQELTISEETLDKFRAIGWEG